MSLGSTRQLQPRLTGAPHDNAPSHDVAENITMCFSPAFQHDPPKGPPATGGTNQDRGDSRPIMEHSLLTVSDFVGDLVEGGRDSYMFTVDVARAYKNFPLDPLDWPLACIKWDDQYMVDIVMPFGVRSSSLNMQRVANLIVLILEKEGIKARM